MNLREWRKSKGLGQGEIAEKIGIAQNTYSAWENGRNEIPASGQAKLRKMGYTGPWPREEAQEAPAAGAGAYVTRDEFLKWTGRIERLEAAFEKLGEVVRDLVRESEEARLRGPKA